MLPWTSHALSCRPGGSWPFRDGLLDPWPRAWEQSLPLALEPAPLLHPLTRLLPPSHLFRAAAPAPWQPSHPMLPGSFSPHRGGSGHCRSPLSAQRGACSASARSLLPSSVTRSSSLGESGQGACHLGTGQGCAAPGRWYSFIVQVLTGLRTGQSWFLWLSPALQWERWVGFFCWFIFPLC